MPPISVEVTREGAREGASEGAREEEGGSVETERAEGEEGEEEAAA